MPFGFGSVSIFQQLQELQTQIVAGINPSPPYIHSKSKNISFLYNHINDFEFYNETHQKEIKIRFF